jgi:hypothetical protein
LHQDEQHCSAHRFLATASPGRIRRFFNIMRRPASYGIAFAKESFVVPPTTWRRPAGGQRGSLLVDFLS